MGWFWSLFGPMSGGGSGGGWGDLNPSFGSAIQDFYDSCVDILGYPLISWPN